MNGGNCPICKVVNANYIILLLQITFIDINSNGIPDWTRELSHKIYHKKLFYYFSECWPLCSKTCTRRDVTMQTDVHDTLLVMAYS